MINGAVIIGSTSQIGTWIHSSLKSRGYNVIKVSRSKNNGNYSISSYSSYEGFVSLFKKVFTYANNVKSIYFCPGIFAKQLISLSDPSAWQRDIEVNLIAAYYCYRAIAEVVRSSSHEIRLVYLGSTASVSKPKGFSSYAIPKEALESLVTYINNEPPACLRACCLRLGTCNTLFSEESHSINIIANDDISNCIDFIENARLVVLPELITMRPLNYLPS